MPQPAHCRPCKSAAHPNGGAYPIYDNRADRLTPTQLAGVPAGGSAVAGTAEQGFLWRLGRAAGTGVEVAIAPNWTATREYMLSDFGRDGVTFPAGGQRISSDLLAEPPARGGRQTIDLGGETRSWSLTSSAP